VTPSSRPRRSANDQVTESRSQKASEHRKIGNTIAILNLRARTARATSLDPKSGILGIIGR
jgi:hypothetical protein